MVKFTLFFMSLFISTSVFAHSGHDHTSAMSGLIHLIWIAPLTVAAVLFATYLKKRFAETRNK